MTRTRVLLVEDDASLRRFVRMVLEDMPIELTECDSVLPALDELAKGPFALILTDLMMPGVSGLGLLERLKATPSLQGDAKVVVLSAGLTAPMRAQLEPMGVWRLLHKPVSLTELEDCVHDALADNPTFTAALTSATSNNAAAEQPPLLHETPPDEAPAAHNTMPNTQAQDRMKAVETYFDGDMDLFEDYRSGCLEQFGDDIQSGDAALQAPDLPTLERLAHSLKTVLLTLGYTVASTEAKALEAECRNSNLEAAQSRWPAVRAALQAIQHAG